MRQRSEGTWEIRAFAGRDPLTGTFRGGKRDAERALAALVASTGKESNAASMTVGELLERWYELAREQVSPSTSLGNRRMLDAYRLPVFGRLSLSKLTTARIDAFYRELLHKGGASGRPLAPASVHRIHDVLRRALGQAERWGWLRVNPAATASPPPRRPSDIEPPDPAAVGLLLEEAERTNPMLAVFIMTAAATGARRGELTGLRWGDVDLEERRMVIAHSIVDGPDGLVLKDTKTHSARRISLDAGTAEILQAHRAKADEVAAMFGTSIGPQSFVFSLEPDGSVACSPNYISRAFRRVAARVGCPGMRLHDLRHFVATRLLSNGIDVRTVAGRLGHRNPNVTLNVYSHFLPEADRNAADVLGEMLSRASAPGIPAPTAPPADDGRRDGWSRPVAVPENMGGPKVTGRVRLPVHIRWSGDPELEFDLDDEDYVRRVYELVLTEGTEADVRRVVDFDRLVREWDRLWLPEHVRRAWVDRHPELGADSAAS
jgi:integrase